MRWVLVEATGRILPEVGLDMGAWTVRAADRPRHRRPAQHPAGVVRGRRVVRSATATEFADRHPGLDRRRQAATRCSPRPTCRSTSAAGCECEADAAGRRAWPDAWAAGDLRRRPGPAPRTTRTPPRAPNAQHAVRQAKLLADNIVAVLAGERAGAYRHKYAGSVASLGLHKGVAQVYGVKLKGWPAWFMHRTYHVSRVPTFNRKARVVADWTLALAVPPRGRLARPAAGPAPRVRVRRQHRPARAPAAAATRAAGDRRRTRPAAGQARLITLGRYR